MSAVEILPYLLLWAVGLAALGFAVFGLLKRSRTLLIVAGAFLISIAAATLRLPDDLPPILRTATPYGIIVAAMAVSWVALTQEPIWLAERLGFKHRSREWEFDRQVTRVIEEFNDVLRVGGRTQPSGHARDELRRKAEDLLASLRSLAAPSPAWQQLVSDYEALIRMHLASLEAPFSEETLRTFIDLNDAATRTRESLRIAYRTEASGRFRWP